MGRSSSFTEETVRELKVFRSKLAKISNQTYEPLEEIRGHYITKLDAFVTSGTLQNHRAKIRRLAEDLLTWTETTLARWEAFAGLDGGFHPQQFSDDVTLAWLKIRETFQRAAREFELAANDKYVLAEGDLKDVFDSEVDVNGVVYEITNRNFGYRELSNGLSFLVNAYHAIQGAIFKYEPYSAERPDKPFQELTADEQDEVRAQNVERMGPSYKPNAAHAFREPPPSYFDGFVYQKNAVRKRSRR